jgi:hypothetical protein
MEELDKLSQEAAKKRMSQVEVVEAKASKTDESKRLYQYWNRETDAELAKLKAEQKSKLKAQRKQEELTRMQRVFLATKGVLGKSAAATKFYVRNPSEVPPLMRRGWVFVKHEVVHIYHSLKLLWTDVKTAVGLMRKITKGDELSRREQRQLRRTTADVFRLVPFSFFVLIPAAEVLLPFALKLFPDMLPTTFKTKNDVAESRKRDLRARLSYASFLQDTADQMAKNLRNKHRDDSERYEQATQLSTLVGDARQGKRVRNEDIIQLASLFRDELTLDSLTRPQLVSLCKYMDMRPIGTDHMLMERLERRMRKIKDDDTLIAAEGIDNLTTQELRIAAQERGMRSAGLTKLGYERNLEQWIDLSINQNIPVSLLIFSRIFTISEKRPGAAESIAKAISSLDDVAVQEALLDAGMVADADKAEFVKKVNEEIREEEEEDKLEEELFQAKRAEKLGRDEAAKAAKADTVTAATAKSPSATPEAGQSGVADGDANEDAVLENELEEDLLEKVRDLATEFETLAKDSAVETERALLEKIKEKQKRSKRKKQTATDDSFGILLNPLDAIIFIPMSSAAVTGHSESVLLDDGDAPDVLGIVRKKKQKQDTAQVDAPHASKACDAATAAASGNSAAAGREGEAIPLDELSGVEGRVRVVQVEHSGEDAESLLDEDDDEDGVSEDGEGEDRNTKWLRARLENFIAQTESAINLADSEIGNTLKLLDTDRSGFVSVGEVRSIIANNLTEELSEQEINMIVERLQKFCKSKNKYWISVEDVARLARDYEESNIDLAFGDESEPDHKH